MWDTAGPPLKPLSSDSTLVPARQCWVPAPKSRYGNPEFCEREGGGNWNERKRPKSTEFYRILQKTDLRQLTISCPREIRVSSLSQRQVFGGPMRLPRVKNVCLPRGFRPIHRAL